MFPGIAVPPLLRLSESEVPPGRGSTAESRSVRDESDDLKIVPRDDATLFGAILTAFRGHFSRLCRIKGRWILFWVSSTFSESAPRGVA